MMDSKNFLRKTDLDAIDRRILEIIQRQARITNVELSERVHLSPSACHRRVQRLEEGGVIDGYAALLNPRSVDRPTTAFVEVSLSNQREEVMAAFEKAVSAVPDVLECHLMTGNSDYLLKVSAADTDDFARIHRIHLASLPHVTKLHSSFAMRTVFKTTALPLDR